VKYFLLMAFCAALLTGFFTLNVPPDTSYAEMLVRVRRGMSLVYLGGFGSLCCLRWISP